MRTFYIASSFKNVAKVRHVARILESKGYSNRYDWTLNLAAVDTGESTLSDLRSIAEQERDAIMGADIVVVLLPGGKSTHVELGIVIAQGKRTILHSPDELMDHSQTTSTFYHLAEVEKCHGTPDDLVAMIVGQDMAHDVRD